MTRNWLLRHPNNRFNEYGNDPLSFNYFLLILYVLFCVFLCLISQKIFSCFHFENKNEKICKDK